MGNQFLAGAMRNEQISQRELGKRTGVKQQTISRLLNGTTKNPSFATAVRLADYFGVNTDEIYRI